jgi:large subunit ribosomal protein L29
MKPKLLRNKTPEELQKLLKEKREELFKLKLDLKARKLKNVKLIGETKRDIARILTILKEKLRNPPK